MGIEYLDLRNLSKVLGVSTRTLRYWAKDPVAPLPCYRPKGKLLFRWNEVEKWMDGHRVSPVSDESEIDAIVDQVINRSKGN